MRCAQCDRDAVGLCPNCLIGQCAHHLAESQAWYSAHPEVTCVHRAVPTGGAPTRSPKAEV
jgi:hypothetical protein